MRYDGVSHHIHQTLLEEAMTDHTTPQTARDQFVTAMLQRMATLARTLSDWVESEPRSLTDIEQQVVRTVKDLGTALLAGLCQLTVPAAPALTVPCPCGDLAHYQRLRPAQVKTVLDTITVLRPYYLCPTCHQGQAPVDQQLGLCAGSLSAGLAELLALLGATEESFAAAATVVEKLTLVSVCPNSVRDATEQLGQVLGAHEAEVLEAAQTSTSAPAVRVPGAPRMYVSMDGLLVHVHEEGFSEVKLAAIYSTTSRRSRKRPDQVEVHAVAHSFVTDLSDATSFGARVWAEAAQRGVLEAREVVVVGDGAHWIWNLTEEYFPDAVEILDWYHATEYLWRAAAAIYGQGSELAKRWVSEQEAQLWEGKVAEVITTLQAHFEVGPVIEETLTYYTNQQQRMRYDEYRARGMQIGSGTIESGCKHVLGSRLKQAGMIWDRAGALAVAKVRTWLKSGRWEEAMRLRPVVRRSYQRHGQAAAQPGGEDGAAGQVGASVAAVAEVPPRQSECQVGVRSGPAVAKQEAPAQRGRPAADHPWRRAWSLRRQRQQVEAALSEPALPLSA
jgi:hypothetical protein